MEIQASHMAGYLLFDVLVSLKWVFDLDNSVSTLKDMPGGYYAERKPFPRKERRAFAIIPLPPVSHRQSYGFLNCFSSVSLNISMAIFPTNLTSCHADFFQAKRIRLL